jgi:hypothetical protein
MDNQAIRMEAAASAAVYVMQIHLRDGKRFSYRPTLPSAAELSTVG